MKILAITSRSATFEIDGNTAYYSPSEYEILLNGKYLRKCGENVFSIFGLQPSADCCVEACGQKINFKTSAETALLNVKQFGAKGDGVYDDSPAFNAALHCAPVNSTVYVPQGKYLIKPLFLKSGVMLYLDKGATLIASIEREHYPILPALVGGELNYGNWQGEEAPCFASPVTAIGAENISVCGEGTIDCNAQSGDWYINHRVMRGAWRPRGVFLNRCKSILLQGITVKNTPSWNIHPYFCTDVKLYGLYLENPADMPTTDGIDADCCNGVDIAGVKISVGDDCIAVKSGTLEFAKKYRTPCKNISIRNCLMQKGHGGVVFGSELSGGIKNITVERCVFDGTDRGFRIKTRRGRGRIGQVGGVTFSDVAMKNVKVPFVINMYYNMGDETGHSEYVWTTEKLSVDERTPELGEFTFKNISCTGVEYSAGAFYGLPEAPIKSIALKNVMISYREQAERGFPDMREKNNAVCRQGFDFHFVKEVVMSNVNIAGQQGDKYIFEGVDSFIEK